MLVTKIVGAAVTIAVTMVVFSSASVRRANGRQQRISEGVLAGTIYENLPDLSEELDSKIEDDDDDDDEDDDDEETTTAPSSVHQTDGGRSKPKLVAASRRGKRVGAVNVATQRGRFGSLSDNTVSSRQAGARLSAVKGEQASFKITKSGEIGAEQLASEADKRLADAFANGHIRQMFIKHFSLSVKPVVFELISFRKQLTGGVKYYCKVKIDQDECAHLELHSQPWIGTIRLLQGELGKKVTDPIEPLHKETKDVGRSWFSTVSPFPVLVRTLRPKRPSVGGAGLLGPVQKASKVGEALKKAFTFGLIRELFVKYFGISPAMFELVSFRKQFANGIRYLCKVQIGQSEYAHLELFQKLGNEVPFRLEGGKIGKQLEDALEREVGINVFKPRPDLSHQTSSKRPHHRQVGITREPYKNNVDKHEVGPAKLEDATEPVHEAKPIVERQMSSGSDRSPIAGGISEVKPASEARKDLAEAFANGLLREQFSKLFSLTPTTFELVSFRSQVVAGTLFFCKVKIGTDNYAHLQLLSQPWRGPVRLVAGKLDKKLEDPIEASSWEMDDVTISPSPQNKLGGVGPERPASEADEQLKEAFANGQIRELFVTKFNVTPVMFELMKFRQGYENGNGVKYYCNVRMNKTKYARLVIRQKSKDRPFELLDGRIWKRNTDPLETF